MSRHLAHRPRYRQIRAYPQLSRHSQREYLRQHWTYRQERIQHPKHPPGYGLVHLPWDWRAVREVFQRRA